MVKILQPTKKKSSTLTTKEKQLLRQLAKPTKPRRTRPAVSSSEKQANAKLKKMMKKK